jgi:hypothetical protein
MSCYEWEEGEIVIPKPQWAKFRKDLLQAWNAKQDEFLAVAKKAHTAAKDAAKGKRGSSRNQAISAALASACGGRLDEYGEFTKTKVSYGWGSFREEDDTAHELYHKVCRMVLKSEGYGRDAKVSLVAPKAKDINKVKISQTAQVSFEDATVIFHNASHTVVWRVYENNHSKDRAHSHWFAKELFRALKGIKWARNSGGTVVGNDEYNRDNRECGGGGNYTTMSFGPETKSRRSSARW